MAATAADLDYGQPTATASGVLDLLGTAPADIVVDGAPLGRDEARQLTDQIRAGIVTYRETRERISVAYGRQAWRALGYLSWASYVAEEFGEELAALGREERREAVADLRSQGMSTRQIAQATGASVGTVHSDLKAAGVQSLNTSESDKPEPAKVTGSDGKQHPAKKTTPPPTPSNVDKPKPAPVDEQTAAKLEQDAKLQAQLDAEMADTAVRFRANWSAALAKACQIWTFDPERLAEVYAADFDTEVDQVFRQMERYIDKVREARRQQTAGLRLIPGGRA